MALGEDYVAFYNNFHLNKIYINQKLIWKNLTIALLSTRLSLHVISKSSDTTAY